MATTTGRTRLLHLTFWRRWKNESVGRGSGLDFRKTFEIVSIAASAGRYVSYREVADFSGLAWKTAQRLMPKHLVNLCEYAHRKGWLRVGKTASIG